MNITDIQACADYFQANYLRTFYLIVTYNGRSFILIGEKGNFPHLMGIQQTTYRSNGYNNPKMLFNDIIGRRTISTNILPGNIASTSKMYKKALNFQNSTDLFWKNKGPLTVNYNPSLSSSKLNNVDVLLTDIDKGYMLGWVSNAKVPVNADISLEKYCICTWIDESAGSVQRKEKYLPGQEIELLRYVFAFDGDSKLIRKKEYNYSYNQKMHFLEICARNGNNLLLDHANTHFYTELAVSHDIHCLINGVQY